MTCREGVFAELRRIAREMSKPDGEHTITTDTKNIAAWAIYDRLCSNLSDHLGLRDDPGGTVMGMPEKLLPMIDRLESDFFNFELNAGKTSYVRQFSDSKALGDWLDTHAIVATGNGFYGLLRERALRDNIDLDKARRVSKLAIPKEIFEILCECEGREPPRAQRAME